MSVAVQNVQEMGDIIKEPAKNGIVNSSHSNGNDPYKHFVSVWVVVGWGGEGSIEIILQCN